MTLFLRDEEVRQVLSMEDMLEAIETMQRHFGHGEAYNLARRKIIARGGMLAVMGGGLFYQRVLGVKTYTVVKGSYSFQVSLYDSDTGKLLCYTQANRLGQLRTGATTGVAVKYLANPDPATVGIIGTGYQAPTQLEAVAKVRHLQRIKAYSRTPERRHAFARSMTDAQGVEVESAARRTAPRCLQAAAWRPCQSPPSQLTGFPFPRERRARCNFVFPADAGIQGPPG